MKPFTCSDREVNLVSRFRKCCDVIRWHRFLNPARLELFQFGGNLNCCIRAKSTVHLNEDFNIGTNSITHRFNKSDRLQLLFIRKLVIACPERIKLQCSIPFFKHPFRGSVEFFRCTLNTIPPVGIRLNLITTGTTKQSVDRLVQRLANNIPARDFNNANASRNDFTRATIVIPK